MTRTGRQALPVLVPVCCSLLRAVGLRLHTEIRTNGKVTAEVVNGDSKAEFPVIQGQYPEIDLVKPAFEGPCARRINKPAFNVIVQGIKQFQCLGRDYALVSLWIKDKQSAIGGIERECHVQRCRAVTRSKLPSGSLRIRSALMRSQSLYQRQKEQTMSAYVVQDQCINAIVTWIYGPRERAWEQRQVEAALDAQGTIGQTYPEKLGNAMFELNCNAVEQRYGDGQAKEFRDLDYEYKTEYLGSNYAVYDRLSEYIYQCSEGDVPESSKLFQALERIYSGMAHEYFRGLRSQEESQDSNIRRELRMRLDALESKLKKSA